MSRAVTALLASGVVVSAGAYFWFQASTALPVAAGTASVSAPSSSSPALPDASGSILPRDYAGPQSCKECHKEKLATWEGHPHRRMNQDATKETVKGDFSGITISYSSGTVSFDTEQDGTYSMTLARDGKTFRKYTITRAVGSRFMQFYIGRQTIGPEPPGTAPYTEEHKLGFGYWFSLKNWLPVSYFDPVGAETQPDGTPTYDPFDNPRVHIWRQNCMLCHNTVPYLLRLALPDLLGGFPQLEHQVAVVPLRSELAQAMDLSQRPNELNGVKYRIQPKNLVTLGISCEACHFGSQQHVKDYNAFVGYLPESPYLRWVDGKTKQPLASDVKEQVKDPRVMNGVCAQCHCATVTLYPNGAGTWNSREALDMIGGACASKIRCIDCHDAHKNDGEEGLATKPQHVRQCVRCHDKFAAPEAARAHSHHEDGTTCLDCHMPRMTQGLEEVVRTHRISSPTDARMLEAGSGNACNLCHLDKSITWTLEKLKAYGKDIAPATSWTTVYGENLSKPVGLAWLSGRDPSMRLVATQAYARSPVAKTALRELISELDDPVAVNRVFTTIALGRILGHPLDGFDVTEPSAKRREKIEKLLAAHPGN